MSLTTTFVKDGTLYDVIQYPPGEKPRTEIDPVTAQVIAGALDSVCLEMGHKLTRMSYSSIIRESEDFGAALLDAEGYQIAECALSTPLQLGPISGYMRGILDVFKQRGQKFYPGDVILHNSAYHGASHEPDVGFCVPVYHKDQLVGFSFTTAHHLDVGAFTPGSCGIVEAVDAYAEGLQFNAIKCYEKGVRNEAVWQILRDNVRASDLVVGDMEAQVAAARIGADRFAELVEQYGADLVLAAGEELKNYSERMMRQAIDAIPDGNYSAVGYIDGFLDDPAAYRKDLKIQVNVTVAGSDMTVDLTGTADQVSDRAINMPLVGTVDIAIYVVLRSMLLDMATHDYIPQNSGLVRPIRIQAPRGCLANPIFPAATIARFCPGNMVADTLMHALAPAVPDKISAGVGNLKVIAYSGIGDGQYWVYMDITEGSWGGRLGKDGMSCVDTLYANTRNNPIEDIESHYPLQVTRYEIRDGVLPGPGKWRGGVGSVRDIKFMVPSHMSLEGDGNKYRPWGFAGGEEGTAGGIEYVNAQTGETIPLPSKIQSRFSAAGDIYRTLSAMGGGYGAAIEREPQKVLEDVLDEIITLDAAREQYGVIVDPKTMAVDSNLTEARRLEMKGSNGH